MGMGMGAASRGGRGNNVAMTAEGVWEIAYFYD